MAKGNTLGRRDPEARREAILSAALDVFAAEGFAAARLDHVAEKPGARCGGDREPAGRGKCAPHPCGGDLVLALRKASIREAELGNLALEAYFLPVHRDDVFAQVGETHPEIGLTAREIGAVIGKSEEATQKVLSRALAAIREAHDVER